MNAAIAQYRPIDNSAFLFSSKNPATGSIQMAKLVGENFEEMGAKFLSKFQNSFVIQPGVVFTWQKEKEIFRGQLLTSIVSGFDEWNVLDEIEFTIPVTVSKLFSSFWQIFDFPKFNAVFYDPCESRDVTWCDLCTTFKWRA